ncbi:MAG: hypothetical protein LBU65_07880 [Planctomycetaceae bacterium]|jgi:hypothetical protein|nr:hypothetical protein [Planctomycetaceae bacterium]
MKHFELILILILIFLVGCSDNSIKVVPIHGTVTQAGKPVEGAMVVLSPKSDENRSASGITDSAGNFEVLTLGAMKNGAMPGEYAVLISKHILVDANGREIPEQKDTAYNPMSTATQPPIKKAVLPKKYNDSSKPLFTVEVKTGRNDPLVLELE